MMRKPYGMLQVQKDLGPINLTKLEHSETDSILATMSTSMSVNMSTFMQRF